MRIGDLIARALPGPTVVTVAAAAGTSPLKLSITRNWKAAMTEIADRIETAERRRADLVAKRRDLLVQELDGEPAAAKELTRTETEIDSIDRDLARLRDARGLAAERAEADETASRRQAAAEALARWEAGNEQLVVLARRADDIAREAAGIFARLAAATETQAASCPVELPGSRAERVLGAGRVEAAVKMTMAGSGATWAGHGLALSMLRPDELMTAESAVANGIAWARAEIQRRGART
jgi:hypothetical protein